MNKISKGIFKKKKSVLLIKFPEPTLDGPQCNTRCRTAVIVKCHATLPHQNETLLRKIKRNWFEIRTLMLSFAVYH